MVINDISEDGLVRDTPKILKWLLKDHTTKKNIVWATKSYELLGKGFLAADAITSAKITGNYKNLIRKIKTC